MSTKTDARTDLESCLAQVDASKAWFQRRVLPLSIDQLRWRPDPGSWSVAECLDHLNRTLELYLPKIGDAIARGRLGGKAAICPSTELDALKLFEPPVAHGDAAPASTLPGAPIDPDLLVESFDRNRDNYVEAVRRAAGLDLLGIRIHQPIYTSIVSLGGTLAMIAAHDRRHLWQAERVILSPRFPHAF